MTSLSKPTFHLLAWPTCAIGVLPFTNLHSRPYSGLEDWHCSVGSSFSIIFVLRRSVAASACVLVVFDCRRDRCWHCGEWRR